MRKDEALKIALEALVCLKKDFDADQFEWEIADEAITAIKEAMAQPEQEPIGQLCEESYGRGQVMWFNKPVDGSYVYTTPPQRTWVGLTEEEIESLQRLAIDPVDANGWGFLNRESYAHLIEAKLKEKNNTTLAEQTGEESSILFSLNDGKEVMRIDKNGVTANPEIRVDEAGAHVISALDVHIKNLIKAERNACAKLCETLELPEWPDKVRQPLAQAIRAR